MNRMAFTFIKTLSHEENLPRFIDERWLYIVRLRTGNYSLD